MYHWWGAWEFETGAVESWPSGRDILAAHGGVVARMWAGLDSVDWAGLEHNSMRIDFGR